MLSESGEVVAGCWLLVAGCWRQKHMAVVAFAASNQQPTTNKVTNGRPFRHMRFIRQRLSSGA
jgi:hypothetical protein